MKRSFIFIAFILLGFPLAVKCQYKVHFIVSQPSLLHTMDTLYLAGSFNLWNPADKSASLATEKDGRSSLSLSLPAGDYEYKFTRGSWNKVESNAGGFDIANRSLTLKSDTTIMVSIRGWKDDFKSDTTPVVKKHSASVNVKIMDTAFYMPQLQRYRRIWIYLPEGYASSSARYPVLYMHDGQNIFDNLSAYADEWGVDEYLDSAGRAEGRKIIVVGVDNGLSKRMNEYNPWEFQNFGKGEGDLYVDFLVQTLKPYIDKHYRTLPAKKNTFIAGSSMGGLISLFAVLKYPGVYGGAGIFSPAFWTASGIDSAVKAYAAKVDSRLFFYAGGLEGDAMVPDMKRIEKEIGTLSPSPLKEVIDTDARHNESAWEKHFPAFYEWVIERKK